MEEVIIRFWPNKDGWEDLVDDIEKFTGQAVAFQIHGRFVYRQRNIYANVAEEDALYLALKHGPAVVEFGEETKLKHKKIGL